MNEANDAGHGGLERWLAAKADGSLDRERDERVDRHLAECDACRRLLDDQRLVRSVLASVQMPEAPADFIARVNAGIDATEGWFGLADFRAWTLRLVPAAAAAALLAVLWPASGASSSPSSSASERPQVSATSIDFSPSRVSDWDRDVSANALLDAALRRAPGDSHVR